jgi:long-chain acyl-CoA synthetase
VNFGEGGEAFGEDLHDLQPTFFVGVPRIWEKMMAGVQMKLADATPLKRAVAGYFLNRGRLSAGGRMERRSTLADRVGYAIGWMFVYRPLRHQIGLARVRVALSGAAPVSTRVLEFFWSIGVPVREGYGMTENTAIAACSRIELVRPGTVGPAMPGVELKIAPNGEILTRSASVFAGYLHDPEATAAVLDADGWLHTGDVGTLDSEGLLRITDRMKDIIITGGGKNISPTEIENKLKVSPYVREAVVVGDGRRYLTALIGIEADTVGDWASRERIPYTTYADLSSRPEVRALVSGWVEEVNSELASVETIKKFALLPKELDTEEGELTATQKVRRRAVEQQFAGLIEGLYAGSG